MNEWRMVGCLVVTLIDESDIHTLAERHPEKSFLHLKQLMSEHSTTFASNVDTTISGMVFESNGWPLTVNNREYQNALICSPYTTYITYPLDELKKFNKMRIKCLVLVNSVLMSLVYRLTQFNKVVQVNNNLNSLIKHPKLFISLLPEMTRQIIQKYPNHAITFFRVNEVLDTELLKALANNDYLVFPDRTAHVFFPDKKFMSRSHAKRDVSLLRKSSYRIVTHDELKPEDANRLAELYRSLFVEKHSKYNPIYTPHYFRQAIQYRWHEYVALRNTDGQIDAFISWFESEGIMTCGPLGYDAEVDRKMGLYRQLVALCLQHAASNQCAFNMGGGSDEFKQNRGSTETMEYVAAYCKHLPFYRQLPWKILHWMCNKLIKKVIKHANL